MVRQNSIEVYNQINEDNLLSKRRKQVYNLLYEFGPATASEIRVILEKQLDLADRKTINVASRMTELVERKVAYEVAVKKCSVTGYEASLFDITANLPVKVMKREVVPCKACNGTGKVTNPTFHEQYIVRQDYAEGLLESE